MAKVVFYAKPGCRGNRRQRALLESCGHEVEARDLLATAWTAPFLRSFFGNRPVAEWFNAAAIRVKSGEIVPAAFDEAAALAAMIADPLLIRRPLIEAEGRREAGFDQQAIAAWIGLPEAVEQVTDGCVHPHRPRGAGPAASCESVSKIND